MSERSDTGAGEGAASSISRVGGYPRGSSPPARVRGEDERAMREKAPSRGRKGDDDDHDDDDNDDNDFVEGTPEREIKRSRLSGADLSK